MRFRASVEFLQLIKFRENLEFNLYQKDAIYGDIVITGCIIIILSCSADFRKLSKP